MHAHVRIRTQCYCKHGTYTNTKTIGSMCVLVTSLEHGSDSTAAVCVMNGFWDDDDALPARATSTSSSSSQSKPPKVTCSSSSCANSSNSSQTTKSLPTSISAMKLKYARNKRSWQSQLPMSHTNHEFGSWLTARKVDGVWGVGCLVCALKETGGQFAKFEVNTPCSLRLAKLKKHANSHVHKACVAEMLGIESTHVVSAPPLEHFEQVLQDRCDHKSYRKSDEDVGHVRKAEQMTWCLSEALIDMDRNKLRTAESICLHQDMAAPRLLCRFSASLTDFSLQKGILGVSKHLGTTATHLKEATVGLIKQFCSTYFGAPGKPKVEPVFDESVLQEYHKQSAPVQRGWCC